MESNSKKIIIIGSGFGGIAAVLRLRAKKYEVTLIYWFGLFNISAYIA